MCTIGNDEYLQLETKIIELEKQLLKTAPEEVKKLYLEIDFLCQKQNEMIRNSLINY